MSVHLCNLCTIIISQEFKVLKHELMVICQNTDSMRLIETSHLKLCMLPILLIYIYIYIYISKGLQCALTAITIVALWQLPHLGHGIYIYYLLVKALTRLSTLPTAVLQGKTYIVYIYIYVQVLCNLLDCFVTKHLILDL